MGSCTTVIYARGMTEDGGRRHMRHHTLPTRGSPPGPGTQTQHGPSAPPESQRHWQQPRPLAAAAAVRRQRSWRHRRMQPLRAPTRDQARNRRAPRPCLLPPQQRTPLRLRPAVSLPAVVSSSPQRPPQPRSRRHLAQTKPEAQHDIAFDGACRQRVPRAGSSIAAVTAPVAGPTVRAAHPLD